MEAECNAVASGRKRKEEIMGPILRKMLDCFNIVQSEARKLGKVYAMKLCTISLWNIYLLLNHEQMKSKTMQLLATSQELAQMQPILQLWNEIFPFVVDAEE